MTDLDFIAAMQTSLPPLPAPNAMAPAVILKGNADIAIHHPDAVGAGAPIEHD
ncbi:hypothetical protein [Stenotrophomonas chelatiphaga]|uniref:hypothetical protein n=1 Tax=Stenotrophomonas chelatiphaga TaxID=517011 RepID=UPI00289C889B|nr:hypothetical protein [Stenotrophomonas chelatiphaga]